MMESTCNITDYCILRDGKVIHDGHGLFEYHDLPAPAFLLKVYQQLEPAYPKFHKMDNLCKLGFLAAEILLRDRKLQPLYPAEDIGIILYNSASSLDTDRNHQQSISDRNAYYPSPSVFVYTLANIVIGEICIRHKIFGESTFFVSEKFDAQELYTYVKQLFDDGTVKCCLTGWIEFDGNVCDGILYLIEKNMPDTDGIAIFNPEKVSEIYLQRH